MGSTVQALMGSAPTRPDHALMSRARAGDADAREALAQEAGRHAYLFALQLTGSSERALDVAQDSVLRFLAHLDRFDVAQPLAPWIFAIVRNRVRDLARRDRLRRHESLDVWLERTDREPAAPDADPAAIAERHELQVQVWRAISMLGHDHREIVLLRDFHGLSYGEIADVLSIPVGTVMSRLHAARQRLRATMTSAQSPATAHTSARGGDR